MLRFRTSPQVLRLYDSPIKLQHQSIRGLLDVADDPQNIALTFRQGAFADNHLLKPHGQTIDLRVERLLDLAMLFALLEILEPVWSAVRRNENDAGVVYERQERLYEMCSVTEYQIKIFFFVVTRLSGFFGISRLPIDRGLGGDGDVLHEPHFCFEPALDLKRVVVARISRNM